jgi:hypothetical protein
VATIHGMYAGRHGAYYMHRIFSQKFGRGFPPPVLNELLRSVELGFDSAGTCGFLIPPNAYDLYLIQAAWIGYRCLELNISWLVNMQVFSA